VTLSDVYGPAGGGILFNGGSLTLSQSTVSGNSAEAPGEPSGANGGGIYFSGSTLTLLQSTVSGNKAVTGGGIFTNAVTLINSTVANNSFSGEGGAGGGIATSSLSATNSTIAGNGTSGTTYGAGNVFSGGGTVTFANTIVANGRPAGADCNAPQNFATYVSNGGNLSTTPTCGFTQQGDYPQFNPRLESLANNGGPTLTMKLPGDSPAVGEGLKPWCPTVDQRGARRPRLNKSTCDIGAYESGSSPSTVGDDALTGNAQDNVICGLAGSDLISGRAGDDILYGDQCGTGANVARSAGAAAAGDGADRLLGGRGHDRLYGSGGADLLRGGPGADRLRGGAGRDRLKGGAGNDRLHGGRGHDRLDVRGGGRDRVSCGKGRDTVRADERDRLHGCERIR
jgi:Ca2+-binding RTX toxin-like protein